MVTLVRSCFEPKCTAGRCVQVAVDVLIIVSAGNLVDATAFAIRAALQDTVLPEVFTWESGGGSSRVTVFFWIAEASIFVGGIPASHL